MIAFCVLLLNSSLSFAKIKNWAKVNPMIFRGGRPSEALDVKKLKAMGIQTIIDLENNAKVIEREGRFAKSLGMDFISVPMYWDQRPSDSDVNGLLSAMSQVRRSGPIFIHCFHGRDRTGVIVALYRVFVESWDAESAYREMLKLGFNVKFKPLLDYFSDRTGYIPTLARGYRPYRRSQIRN